MNKANPVSAFTELTVQLQAVNAEPAWHDSVTRAVLGKHTPSPEAGREIPKKTS